MANICENELRAYSEDSRNIQAIQDFFEKDYKKYKYIDQPTDEDVTVYFDSAGSFPENDMQKLYENIPNKEDNTLEIGCLSVEWGNYYSIFHTCTADGWHIEP